MKKMLENGLIPYNVQIPYLITLSTGYAGEEAEETLLAQLDEFGGNLAQFSKYDTFPQSIVDDGEAALQSHKESYGSEEDEPEGEFSLSFYTDPNVPPEDVSPSQGIPIYSDLYCLWVLLQVGEAHNQLMQLQQNNRVLSSENRTMKSRLTDIAKLSEGY